MTRELQIVDSSLKSEQLLSYIRGLFNLNLWLRIRDQINDVLYETGPTKNLSNSTSRIFPNYKAANSTANNASGRSNLSGNKSGNKSNRRNQTGKGKCTMPSEFNGLKVDISPRKVANTFNLPLGATVTIGENQFTRKDRFTCVMVPPNKRSDYCPALGIHDKLSSSMYVFTSMRPLKVPVEIELPCLLEETTHVNALIKTATGWKTIEDNTRKPSCVRFPIQESGTLVLLWTPSKETLTLSTNGGLYFASTNPLIQIRVPKTALLENIECVLQVIGVRKDRIEIGRQYYLSEMKNVIEVSPFYEFIMPPIEFKRTVTLRLPLPEWAESHLIDPKSPRCLMVTYKINNVWDVIDVPLRFTQSTVSFETRVLGKFCLVSPYEGRRQRVKMTMPYIEDANHAIRGQILTFIMMEIRAWYVWIECVRTENIFHVMQDKLTKGFKLIKRESTTVSNDDESARQTTSTRSRSAIKGSNLANTEDEIEFLNGNKYHISVSGDAVLDGDVSLADKPGSTLKRHELLMQYHELLPDTYRVFEIKPKTELVQKIKEAMIFRHKQGAPPIDSKNSTNKGEESLNLSDFDESNSYDFECFDYSAKLKVYLASRSFVHQKDAVKPSNTEDIRLQQTFKIPMPFDTIRQYFDIPLLGPSPDSFSKSGKKKKKSTKDKHRKIDKINTTTLNDEVSESDNDDDDEYPVLSRISLFTLSKGMEEGLTLAVYLGLPENTITSVGFDCLSSNANMATLCYRILVVWKNQCRSAGQLDAATKRLEEAYKSVGDKTRAKLVAHFNQTKAVITPEAMQEFLDASHTVTVTPDMSSATANVPGSAIE